MQKYVIIFLSVVVLGLVAGAWWQRKDFLDQIHKLNEDLAKSQQLVKETETAVSSAGIEIQNLKTSNKDLQTIIQKRKEDIVALTDLSVQWKNKYFEIKNAKQEIVDQSGSQPASLSADCEECLSKARLRVDFDKTKDDLRVYGFTLSNPAQANINLEWLKPLKLQLVLTKDQAGDYKVYVDEENKTESANVVPTELSLKVDPSVFNTKWYERIAFGADLGASQLGINTSIKAMYGIKNNLYFGPAVSLSLLFKGTVAPFYGVSILWMPWMRN